MRINKKIFNIRKYNKKNNNSTYTINLIFVFLVIFLEFFDYSCRWYY